MGRRFAVPDLARRSGLATDEQGRVLVDASLRSVSHPEVFAAGDSAWPVKPVGVGAVRPSAYTSTIMGAQAGTNVARELAGKSVKPLRFGYLMQSVSLGRRDGLVQFTDGNDKPLRMVATCRVAARIKEFVERLVVVAPCGSNDSCPAHMPGSPHPSPPAIQPEPELSMQIPIKGASHEQPVEPVRHRAFVDPGRQRAHARHRLHGYVKLAPGAWVAQTGASSATAGYVLALAKHGGLRTLNVVRRAESLKPLLDAGADVVLVEGADLTEQAADAIGDAPIVILDAVAGEPVAQLASLLKIGGQIISYTARARQPLSIPVVDLIFRGLSVHGYWLNLWLQRTPQDTVAQIYRELAALVADGTLSAPVEATYALANYREAIAHAARSDRHGKVLFALG